MKAEIKVKVKKFGNSAVIRIPLHVLEGASLNLEEEVVIREKKGCIVMEGIQAKEYDLKNLLKGITPNYQHRSVDVGKPQGEETW